MQYPKTKMKDLEGISERWKSEPFGPHRVHGGGTKSWQAVASHFVQAVGSETEDEEEEDEDEKDEEDGDADA